MATLATIVWIISVFLFFKEFFVLFDEAKDSGAGFFFQLIFLALIFVHGIIIYPITNGIFFDLYGKFPNGELTTVENVRLALISGFIALGVVSVSSFFIHQDNRENTKGQTADVQYSRLPPNRHNISAGKAIMFGIEVIGFISAVLGIISFYLDYLK